MITPNEILDMVSLETGIPVEVIKNPKIRLSQVVNARHRTYQLMYDKCFMSSTKSAIIIFLALGVLKPLYYCFHNSNITLSK